MSDLLQAGTQFGSSVPEQNGDFAAKSTRPPGRVHGGIAATHHHGALADSHWRVGLGELVSLHQVDAGEKFVGGVNAHQVLSRYTREVGQPGACAQEDGVVSCLKQFFQRGGSANNEVGTELYPHLPQPIDLFVEDFSWQPEVGNTVSQYASQLVQCLKDRHPVAFANQVEAAISDAGPLPTRAIFRPRVSTFSSATSEESLACRCRSATNRSRVPMATGSSFFPSKQAFSQKSSCWQTRPQIPGKGFCSLILAKAASKSPSPTREMKLLMSMCKGQASMHLGSLHCRQRRTSTFTCSGEKPSATSSHPSIRTSGARCNTPWRGALGLGLRLGLASIVGVVVVVSLKDASCFFSALPPIKAGLPRAAPTSRILFG